MWLRSFLLDSSILNYGSAWLHVTLSTTLYHGTTWVYFTLLQSTMALLGSATLYRGSILDWLATCGSTTLLEEPLMLRQCDFCTLALMPGNWLVVS